MDILTATTRVTCCMCLLLNFGTLASVSHCTQAYTTDDGKQCSYCPPGTYVSSDCGQSGQSANCHGCEPGYYQSNCTRGSSCEKCAPACRWPYTIKVKGCTLYHDIVCQCVAGRYWKKETENDGVCLRHSMCRPGFGLVALGTAMDDTLCEPCVKGQTFSPEVSIQRCHVCSKCKAYYNICTVTLDAVWDNSSVTKNPTETSTKDDDNETVIHVALPASISLVVIGIIIFVIYFYRKRQRSYTLEGTPAAERLNEAFEGIELANNVDADNRNKKGINTGGTQNGLAVTTDVRQNAIPYPYDGNSNEEYRFAIPGHFPRNLTRYKSDGEINYNTKTNGRNETESMDRSFGSNAGTESSPSSLVKTIENISSIGSNERLIEEEYNAVTDTTKLSVNSGTDDSTCSGGFYAAESGQCDHQIMELKTNTMGENVVTEKNSRDKTSGIEETQPPIKTKTISLSAKKQKYECYYQYFQSDKPSGVNVSRYNKETISSSKDSSFSYSSRLYAEECGEIKERDSRNRSKSF